MRDTGFEIPDMEFEIEIPDTKFEMPDSQYAR
jgi:hypothetical protein